MKCKGLKRNHHKAKVKLKREVTPVITGLKDALKLQIHKILGTSLRENMFSMFKMFYLNILNYFSSLLIHNTDSNTFHLIQRTNFNKHPKNKKKICKSINETE